MRSFFRRVFDLYYDGFRQMTLGRTLWLIIGIKLFVIFVVLKIFFFPDFIGQNAEKGKEADFVAGELRKRSVDPLPTPSPGEEALPDANQPNLYNNDTSLSD